MKFKFLIYKIIFCFFLNSLCFAETKSLYGKKLFSKDKSDKSISDKNSRKSLYGKKLFAKKKDRNTDEAQEKFNGINFYTGMFDFSDDGKRSVLYGIEHQNENLYRDTIFGRITPVSGAMITQDTATYIYTGVETNYSIGKLNITPSFTPGLYSKGDGKDLGHPLEFKSEVQMSIDLSEGTNLGMSYNHVSNASLGDKNPGANSYMFNFLKKF